MFQRQSVKELHRQKPLPFMVGDFVNGADVRVVQRGSGARFPAKTLQRLRILGHIIGQKFQGDKSAKHRVFRLIDDAHAAAAEFFDNAIVRDGLADHQGQILRGRIGQVNESGRDGSGEKGC